MNNNKLFFVVREDKDTLMNRSDYPELEGFDVTLIFVTSILIEPLYFATRGFNKVYNLFIDTSNDETVLLGLSSLTEAVNIEYKDMSFVSEELETKFKCFTVLKKYQLGFDPTDKELYLN
jgi:hypothetical protein